MRILFLGDMVGKPSRKAVAQFIGAYRQEKGIDLVVANSDNLAHGRGVTKKTVEEMLGAGVDILTSGDHAWDNPQVFEVLKASELNFLCPANLEGTDPALSGREFEIGGIRILVLNLLGQVFVERKVTSPFEAVEKLLARHEEQGKAKVILLDFHAEATSEKKAMGRYLAGKVTAVLGTHTHVQTADEEILPGGTAYLTDAGMTGAKESILGCEVESVLDQFVKGTAFKYKIAEAGPVRIEGAVIEADEEGRAVRIERIQEEVLPLD